MMSKMLVICDVLPLMTSKEQVKLPYNSTLFLPRCLPFLFMSVSQQHDE